MELEVNNQKAEEYKNAGNEYFKKKSYALAIE